MKRVIDVVGAVIVRDGLVYCVQRGPEASLPGMWEFPGGKVEPEEDKAAALRREISEELICEVEVRDEITTTTYPYDFGTVRLTTYYCELMSGEPTLTEHSAEQWLHPGQLSDLSWAPADIPAVHVVTHQMGESGN